MMTTTNTATGLIFTAAPMTNWVTTSWTATAATMLTMAHWRTTLGSRMDANAGSTIHPMSGPIHGMNTMSPATKAISGAYGTPKTMAASPTIAPKMAPMTSRPRTNPPNEVAMAVSSSVRSR